MSPAPPIGVAEADACSPARPSQAPVSGHLLNINVALPPRPHLIKESRPLKSQGVRRRRGPASDSPLSISILGRFQNRVSFSPPP